MGFTTIERIGMMTIQYDLYLVGKRICVQPSEKVYKKNLRPSFKS